jgi:hypothetical protein
LARWRDEVVAVAAATTSDGDGGVRTTDLRREKSEERARGWEREMSEGGVQGERPGESLSPSPTALVAVACCRQWRRGDHGGDDTEVKVGGDGLGLVAQYR